LQRLGIPDDKLPRIDPSGSVLGRITEEAAKETGLEPGTPVVLGAFDHPCAARGAGILDEGQLLLSCGTSWVGFLPIRDRNRAVDNNLLIDPFLQPSGPWGAMFSLPAVASSIDEWIRLFVDDGPDRYQTFDRLAASAAPGAGGLLIHPLHKASRTEPEGGTKANIARAIMEGTAFLLKRRLDQLEAKGMRFSAVSMVGGPSEAHPWPQIVTDVLGKRIAIRNGTCAGAVGAAILAGIGAGLYQDEKHALTKLSFPQSDCMPSPAAHAFYAEQYNRFVSKFGRLGKES
jgi:sugar (pentulose or hexulose) kinase